MGQISLDARGLSLSSFALTTVAGWIDARILQVLDLEVGTYQWIQANGILPDAVFSILQDGSINYSSSADSFFSGRGTQTLTVTGQTVTLDFTQVTSFGGLYVVGITGWLSAGQTHALNLLPGNYKLRNGNDAPEAELGFTVGRDGLISYDAADEGVLVGAGTAVLAVVGLPVALDFKQVTSSAGLYLVNITSWLAAGEIHDVKLLPGQYGIRKGDATPVAANGFSVGRDGRVSYEAAEEGFLLGAGTATLGVKGLPVTLDFTQVNSSAGLHLPNFTSWLAEKQTHDLNLLPGKYQLHKGDNTPVSPQGFEVQRSGLLSYDASDEGIFRGTGTATLGVRGLLVRLDFSQVTSSAGLHLPNFTTWLPAGASHDLQLLPGHYPLHKGDNTPAIDHGFSVGRDGLLAYEVADEGVLLGAGTTTLAVVGFPIDVNLDDLTSSAGVHLPGITSWIHAEEKPRLRLLPGGYEFRIGNNVRTAETAFTVLRDGTVTYPGENDSVLTGRGTSSLTLHGHAVTLDARQLSIGGAFHLPGITSWLVANELQNLKLLKSSYQFIHSLTGAAAEAGFSVDAEGLFDYPDSSAQLLEGKGGTLLQIRGCGLGIDATAFPGTRVVLAPHNLEIDTGTGLPTTWHLLPQDGLRLDIYDTSPPRQVLFDLKADGTVVFKAEYPFIGTTQQEGHVVLVLLGDEPLKKKVPCRRQVFLGRMS